MLPRSRYDDLVVHHVDLFLMFGHRAATHADNHGLPSLTPYSARPHHINHRPRGYRQGPIPCSTSS